MAQITRGWRLPLLACLLAITNAAVASAQISLIGTTKWKLAGGPNSIAFDSVNQVYLQVSYGSPVKGRFLDKDGTPVGGDFVITLEDTGSNYCAWPSVAFGGPPSDPMFLVTYRSSESRNGPKWGRLIRYQAGSAPLVSTRSLIATVGGAWFGMEKSQSTWDGDEFIVGTSVQPTGVAYPQAQVQTFDTSGNVSAPQMLANDGLDYYNARGVACATNGVCAAVGFASGIPWLYEGGVWARLFTKGTLAPLTGMFYMDSHLSKADDQTVIYNSHVNKFLAAWLQTGDSWTQNYISTRTLDTDGTMGPAPDASRNFGPAAGEPRLAYNSLTETSLLVTKYWPPSGPLADLYVLELGDDGAPVNRNNILHLVDWDGSTSEYTPAVAADPINARWIATYSLTGAATAGGYAALVQSDAGLEAPTAVPGQVTLLGPSGTVTTDRPVLSWTRDTQARSYFLWLTDANGKDYTPAYASSTVGCARSGNCSVLAPAYLPEGTARFAVRPDNSLGQGTWSAWMSFTVNTAATAPSAKPTLLAPSGTITTDNPAYSWNPVSGATSYFLWINAPNGTTYTYSYSSAAAACATQCSARPPLYLTQGAAQFFVRPDNSAGQGPFSDGMSFTVNLGGVTPAPTAPGKPTLIAPSGTIATDRPIYSWNAVSGAAQYFLWINASSGTAYTALYTAAEVGCGSGSGTCSGQPLVYLPSGASSFLVRAQNSAGSTWSDAMSFTVNIGGTVPAPTAPGKPTLIGPSGSIATDRPVYSWNAVTGATSYFLWVNDPNGNMFITPVYTASEAGCASGSGTCAVQPLAYLPQGTSQFFVRAQNAAGQTWSDPMSFTVTVGALLPAPGKPTLLGPTGTISTDRPIYRWNAVSGAVSYFLYVNDPSGNNFIAPLYTASEAGCASGTGTCSVQPVAYLPQGTCQFWVRAQNSVGQTWSDPMTFTVSLGPVAGKPTLLAPTGTIATDRPVYQWSAVSGATSYFLWVNDPSGNMFITPVYSPTEAGCASGTGTCSVQPLAYLPRGTSTFWVRATSSAGLIWSEPMMFTVAF